MRTLRLRTDALGYLLDEEVVDGFPDREELPTQQRVTIAQWAARFTREALSESQARLLKRREPRRSSERQRSLAASRELLADLVDAGLWETLSQEERAWVVRPAAHPELSEGVAYPLSTGQLARLCGASERQVRGWIDSGLVTATRERGARRVYAGGAAQALLLAHQSQPEKTVLARIRSGEGSSFMALLATAMRTWAHSCPAEVRPLRVEEICQGMSVIGRAMAGEPVELERLRLGRPGSVVWEPPEWSIERQRGVRRFSCVVHEPRDALPEPVLDATHAAGAAVRPRSVEQQPGEYVLLLGEESESSPNVGALFGSAVRAAGLAMLTIELLDDKMTIVETYPYGDRWAVKIIGNQRVTNVARTKAEAERLGRELAIKRGGAHVVYRRDGSVQGHRLYATPGDSPQTGETGRVTLSALPVNASAAHAHAALGS